MTGFTTTLNFPSLPDTQCAHLWVEGVPAAVFGMAEVRAAMPGRKPSGVLQGVAPLPAGCSCSPTNSQTAALPCV